MNLKDRITDYPNFPKKGILVRDFSPILKDPSALSYVADEFAKISISFGWKCFENSSAT